MEVNGVNISQENHKQVVQRIKAIPNETRLLVVDKVADDYYKKQGLLVKSNMPNVAYKSSEEEPESNVTVSTVKAEVNGNFHGSNGNFHENVETVEINDNQNVNNSVPDAPEEEVEENFREASPKSSVSSMDKKPMSVSSDDGSSPRTTPSPNLERSDSDRTDWDGLNLSLTAREMRELIGSKKKSDPRKDKLDMKKKFEIVQTL